MGSENNKACGPLPLRESVRLKAQRDQKRPMHHRRPSGCSSPYSCLDVNIDPSDGRWASVGPGPQEMDPDSSDRFYFGRCVRCGEEVRGAGRACRAMGHLFHGTCFTCCVCGKLLVGKAFYAASGRIYCEEDFLYSGAHPVPEVCESCGFLISDSVLQARGKSYHPSCFRCVVCGQGLEGLPFTVDSQSRVYCVRDYHRVWAPRCDACRGRILPAEGSSESVRIKSCDKNYHVNCYKRNLRTGSD